MNDEQAWTRFLALVDDDSLDDDAVLKQFRGERRQARHGHERGILAMRDSHEYRLTIPELAKFRTTGDTIIEGPKNGDWYPLRYDKIDNFCKKFGMKRGALMEVLEGRALEIKGRGITWRLYNSPYVDRTAKRQEQEAYRIEDEKYAAELAERAKANVPTAFPQPVARSWEDL